MKQPKFRIIHCGLLCAILALGATAPLAFTSCENKHPEISITLTSDYSGIIEAINNVNKTLTEKLALIEQGIKDGNLQNKQALDLIQKAIEAMNGTVAQKLEAIKSVIESQTTSLEGKLGLIEAAIKNGLADNKTAQELIKSAIESLSGSLEQKLEAIKSAIESQTTSLASKLALIETAVKEGFADNKTAQGLIEEALETLNGTLEEKLAAIEEAITSQTTSLAGKLDLIEAALKTGFTDQKTALGQIKSALESLKGSVDGLDDKIDEVVTALGNIKTAFGDNAAVLEEKLAAIFDAISGLTDFEAIIPAILAAIEDAARPIPDVERQWIIRNGGILDGEAYDKIYDFGYTFKNYLVGWDSYQTPYKADLWNSSRPYTISLLPNGWVKLSQEDGRFFYQFSEVTPTTATAKFYFRDYADAMNQMGSYSLDDYGWTNGYVYHFELVDPALPLTWSQFVLRIGGKNHRVVAASYDDNYNAEEVLKNDVLMGGSGGELEVVAMNGVGTAEEFETLAAQGVDFTGKLVVLHRGSIPFAEKLQNASEAGAAAVLCADNQDGLVNSNVYTLPSSVKKIPFFTVTKEVGELFFLSESSDFYYYQYQMSWIEAFFATINDPNNLYND